MDLGDNSSVDVLLQIKCIVDWFVRQIIFVNKHSLDRFLMKKPIMTQFRISNFLFSNF